MRRWLLAYPQSLVGKKVDFKGVLDAPDKDTITLLVVNKELSELSYERHRSWLKLQRELRAIAMRSDARLRREEKRKWQKRVREGRSRARHRR